ncbi:hypothetical protein ACLOJK_013587 [Asimina triloba]
MRSRAEAERCLGVAEKLLTSRDLINSKSFAVRAQQSDPTLDGPEQIIAIADVLIASQKRINNHMDWYAILQLDPQSDTARLDDSLKKQYHKLVRLLHPDNNRSIGADNAFKLVVDAWAVLSDPGKRSQYDRERYVAADLDLNTSAPMNSRSVRRNPTRKASSQDPDARFWTSCPFCCNLHEYQKQYENCRLRCQNCHRGFHAEAIPKLPPIVPGMDAYYCAWGFFPLGIWGPSSSSFENFPSVLPNSGSEQKNGQSFGFPSWKPFFPMFPGGGSHPEEVWNSTAPAETPIDLEDSSLNDPDWISEGRRRTRNGPSPKAYVETAEPLRAVPISMRNPKKKKLAKRGRPPKVRKEPIEDPEGTEEQEWVHADGGGTNDGTRNDMENSAAGIGSSEGPGEIHGAAQNNGEPQNSGRRTPVHDDSGKRTPVHDENAQPEPVDIPSLLKLLGVKDEEMNMTFDDIGGWDNSEISAYEGGLESLDLCELLYWSCCFAARSGENLQETASQGFILYVEGAQGYGEQDGSMLNINGPSIAIQTGIGYEKESGRAFSYIGTLDNGSNLEPWIGV